MQRKQQRHQDTANINMNVHPVIARAIKRHGGGGHVDFYTSEPYVRSSIGNSYFTKIGSKSEKEYFEGEAEALKLMHIAAPGLAPQLIECGLIDEETCEYPAEIGKPYFVSEYKEMSSLTDSAARKLAQRLATELHAYKSTNGFGFPVPTFCGRTRQDNGWYDTWEECFDALIGGLLDKIAESGGYSELCKKGEQVRNRVMPALLGPLVIEPVLLHGDLWSGNTGVDNDTGEPVIYDPAAYFGHNEADLAIARIFGGFPKSFFTTYHEYLPKTEPQDQYELRGDLYELYHYLNHTVLFGGGYASSARAKMDRLLKAFP